jgi:hypothetical protein
MTKSSYGKKAVIVQVEPSVTSSASRSSYNSYSSRYTMDSESSRSSRSSSPGGVREQQYRVFGAGKSQCLAGSRPALISTCQDLLAIPDKHTVTTTTRNHVTVIQGGQKSYIHDAPTPDTRANSDYYHHSHRN